MLRFLLPQEIGFFNFFDEHIELTIEGARELVKLTSDGSDMKACAERIREVEHRCDQVTRQCLVSLHKTFITPMDRSDIHNLIKKLDDIMDFADSAASRIALYNISKMRPEANKQAEILLKASLELKEALSGLRNTKNVKAINDRCVAVHKCENEGDAVLNDALVKLFNSPERDAIDVIMWKEIFESLEKAIDRCQDVAMIIEGMVIEAS